MNTATEIIFIENFNHSNYLTELFQISSFGHLICYIWLVIWMKTLYFILYIKIFCYNNTNYLEIRELEITDWISLYYQQLKIYEIKKKTISKHYMVGLNSRTLRSLPYPICSGIHTILTSIAELLCKLMHNIFKYHWIYILSKEVEQKPVSS